MAGGIEFQDENSFGNQAFRRDESEYSDSMSQVEDAESRGFSDRTSDAWGNNQAKKLADQKNAEKDGRQAEQTALNTQGSPGNALEAEQITTSNQQGDGFYRSSKEKDAKKSKKAGLKKYGPIATVLTVLIAMAVLFASSSFLASIGLVANGLEQFNAPLHTSMNRRSTLLMPMMLRGGLNSKNTNKGLFGPGSNKFKITESMSKRLAKNGIKYIETTGTDGKPVNVLVYDDGPNNKPMVVAAYDGDRNHIPSSIDVPTGKVDASGNPATSKIDFDDNSKFSFDDALDKHTSFFKAEEKSTRTLKGHIAGWFDSVAEKLDTMTANHGRNRQQNAKPGSSDEDIQNNASLDGLKEEADDMSGDVDVDRNDVSGAGPNSSSNPDDIDPVSAKDGSGAITKGMDTPEVETALKSRAKTAAATLGQASAIFNTGGFACAAIKVINTISQTVSALQRAHILNYATGFLEVAQKAKAGDASSEIHYYMNSLSKRGPTRDMNGDIIPGKESSSSMMSDAFNQFFSDGNLTVKASDPSARKFNSELAMQQAVFHGEEIESNDIDQNPLSLAKLFESGGGGLATYKSCVNLQLAGSVLATLADIATLIAAVPSFGLAPVLKVLFSQIMRQGTAIALTLAVSGLISFIAPLIAKTLAKNLMKNMVGEDAAYAINSGFHMYTGKQMQLSSGLPATEETLISQYKEHQKVIASESRYIRETRSPFDLNSKYTFFGSLMYSLIPIATTMSSPLTTISKISTSVASSINKFSPTASADGISKIKTSINKNCPSANAIEPNLIADAFCNTYKTSDFSTIQDSFSDVFDQVGSDNFQMDKIDDDTENGNPQIKDDSELAKWVLSCAVRESPYGVADGGIAEKLKTTFGTGTVGTVVGAVIGSIPVVGSLLDVANNGQEFVNQKWITGENCSDPQYKYFSRYSEDQRLFESAGLIEKSSVTAFLDRYYEKNPLDFTDSGIVARYSGMTKEQAELGLGLLEYNLFLAKYNPKDKGPEKQLKTEDYQYESRSIIAHVIPEIINNLKNKEHRIFRQAFLTA